jgi:molybdopterin molybdotransferase
MLSVAEALERITRDLVPVEPEQVGLTLALGRVLAEDVAARVTQPPAAVSAMDGYAVRAADVARVPAELSVIGRVPAGASFVGRVGPAETVRIFTGAPVPDGADAIVIQEDADAAPDGRTITVRAGAAAGRYIRPAGLDFKAGQVGLRAGRVLSVRDIGLAAAMNRPWLKVRRRPRVAILATGDEIVRPGDPIGPNQIVSSNGFALAAFVTALGGIPIDLGIAADTLDSLKTAASGARGTDLLITTGGASVGEHDLVQQALGEQGLALDFWRIAMRPGKPLMFGRIDGVPMLGLPGNPVSTVVCALLFLKPALERLLGIVRPPMPPATAVLTRDLAANDRRQDYLRARLAHAADGQLSVTPFDRQDSSMLSFLAQADCLIVRPPEAPPAKAGERVEIVAFGSGLVGL